MRIPKGYVRYMLDGGSTFDPSTHALRQWWKNFKEAMAGCNYFPSKADPCLFIKKANCDDPPSFVIVYVDD
jgi:hypothetical protein